MYWDNARNNLSNVFKIWQREGSDFLAAAIRTVAYVLTKTDKQKNQTWN